MARKLTATTPEAPRVFDTATNVDVWPILAADADALAAEIARGDHDGVLSTLAHLDATHYGGRGSVQGAIVARRGG